jgi:4-amino-4-deoxy-L-arabinose transferase-like glycosyltransferase
MRGPLRRWEWIAIAAVTVGAAVLRVIYLSRVSPDPFYDAAVRSMGLSFHNFFFGAFEPGGSVSIDKPPIDLWLQVASVKLFGFSSTTLKLPEAFAGVASVPLLFAAVRRMWSPAAGIAAAVALAVLPIEVITARSDTMDAVMMALLVLALLLFVRAVDSDRLIWLLAGAVALGLAFNVKLLESLVALPGIAVFAYLGLPGSRARRLSRLAIAGVVYVAVALSWLTATLVVPASERPYAIGSSNGSAWNAAFVFNGTERLGGKSPEPQGTVYVPGHHYPVATQSQRDHIPIVPPSPTRLLARVGPLSGERLGLELLIALLLGIPALILGARGRPADSAGEGERGQGELRMRRATAAGIGVWVLSGTVLFSQMARLHPRYVEAFTPAVAALLGIGVAWVASPAGRLRLGMLAGALLVALFYAERLLYGVTGAWAVAFAGAAGALAFAVLARVPGAPSLPRSLLAPAGVLTMTLVAVLAIPLSADVTAIEAGVTDAGYVGALPSEEQRLISAYLRAHQGSARYELAAESATGIGSLIVKDARPVLVLTTYNGRVFTTVAQLQSQIAMGRVRYAYLNTGCGRSSSTVNPACSPSAKWVRAHGTDVSSLAGLEHPRVLWLLPGVRP